MNAVMERLWPLIEATPGITTGELRKRCPDLTEAQIYYAVRRNGGISLTLVTKGFMGLRPEYAVRIETKPEPPPAPPLQRRTQGMTYGSGFGQGAAKVAAATQRWMEYGNMIEDTAKIIYDAMLKHAPDHQQYPWVEGGNSLAQNTARSAARKLNLLTPTHIAVIDAAKAKVQSLSQFNQYDDESTAILFDDRLIEAVDALE